MNDFGLPSADTPFFNADTGLVSEAWYIYLANLFTALNNGVVGNTNQVLHGGGAGYSSVGPTDMAGSTAGAVIVAQGITVPPAYRAIIGDVTFVSSGAVTVVKINGGALGVTTPTAANILAGDGSAWQTRTVTGDATITTTGVISVTGITNGLSVNITTSRLTTAGSAGSMTFVRGALTAQVQAT